MSVDSVRESILNPSRVYSRDDILDQPCPVPNQAGIYGWYFREIPPEVPTRECKRHDGFTLLYLGISPSRPSSKGTLRARIKTHYRPKGASTLRRTLDVLLEETLHLRVNLRSNGRFDYGQTEEALTEWMSRNAYVVWIEQTEPWIIEADVIDTLDLPLNINDNRQHAFCPRLQALRADAQNRALSAST